MTNNDEQRQKSTGTDVAESHATSARQSWWQFLKFTLFSISAGLIQVGSFALLNDVFLVNVQLDFKYWLAYLPALVLSVVWNFTFNRKFTFKSASNVPVAMLKVLGYYAVFTPLSTWWGDALDRVGVHEYLILIGTMLINFVTEFLFCKYLVFAKKFDRKSQK